MTDNLKTLRSVSDDCSPGLLKANECNGLPGVGCRGFCAAFVFMSLFVCRKMCACRISAHFSVLPCRTQGKNLELTLLNNCGTKRAALMIWKNCGAQAEQFCPLVFLIRLCLNRRMAVIFGLMPIRYATCILKNEKRACRGLWTG